MNSGCTATPPNELILESRPALKLKSLLACMLTGVDAVQTRNEFTLICQLCWMPALLTHFDGGLQILRLRSGFPCTEFWSYNLLTAQLQRSFDWCLSYRLCPFTTHFSHHCQVIFLKYRLDFVLMLKTIQLTSLVHKMVFKLFGMEGLSRFDSYQLLPFISLQFSLPCHNFYYSHYHHHFPHPIIRSL